MKPGSLSYPLQAARKVKAWLRTQIHIWKFGSHGRRHFRGDPRYNLRYVSAGFASQIDDSRHDRQLLERICMAYKAALQRSEDSGYEVSATRPELKQYLRALQENDYAALGKMFRNFYRDPCSSGLMAAPGRRAKAYFGGRIKNIYRHFYLSHVLYRLDYWKMLTKNAYPLKVLSGPGIGNPFGVVIDGTHIAIGSEYAHYCALRIAGLLGKATHGRAVVGELGGGYGAIAYYLLRDHQPLAYINFDAPERVALSSYYLMKAFPHLKFLLYGEEELSYKSISQADVVLLPISALTEMPPASIDLAFSSHARSTLSPETMNQRLLELASLARQASLYFGNRNSSERIAESLTTGHGAFALTDTRTSGWHSHKVSGAGVGGSAGLASSTLFEQTFTRKGEFDPEVVVARDFLTEMSSLISSERPEEKLC